MERSQSVDVCTVCHEHIEIFAIGVCNHPICYRCSSRMRILCEQMYCPICRTDLNKVVFIQRLIKFENVNVDKFKTFKKTICLENDVVEKSFKKLISVECKLCPSRVAETSIDALRDHVRKEHTLFFCDLCLKNIKIFPFERKFYNRKDLATHRRVGDSDDKSYKGHPLCVFCDERYNDNDELLRHLRKDHYFCHFCDANGSNEYYIDYPDLKTHFRETHFLCEEEECGSPHTQFTNAFRSVIDLKAHKLQHTKGMSKSQIRDASRLEIEIQLPPRRSGRDRGRVTGKDYEDVNSGGRGRGYGHGPGRGGYNRDTNREEQEEIDKAIEASKRLIPGVKTMSWSAEDIRQDFPALSNQDSTSSSVTSATPTSTSVTTNTNSTTSMAAKLSAEKILDNANKAFPQLKKSGAKSSSNVKSDKSGHNSPVTKDKKGVGRTSPVARVMQPVPTSKVQEEDFPDLSSSKSRNSNLISLGVWTKQSQRTDLVRPNIPVEATKPPPPKPVNVNKPKTKSNSLASVGMSLCVQNDFPSLSVRTEKPVSSSKYTKEIPVISNSKNDFPTLGGKPHPASQTVSSKKTVWNPKNTKKSAKPNIDDDFEIPIPASSLDPDVKTETDKNLSSKNKKKKKKNKDKGDNSDSNLENISPLPPKEVKPPKIETVNQETTKKQIHLSKSNDVPASLEGIEVDFLVPTEKSSEKGQKSTSEGKKKQKSSAKQDSPASLDGIAMGLLNEEKNHTQTKPKQKDTTKMLSDSISSISKADKIPKGDKIATPVSALQNAPMTNILSSLNDFPSLSTSVKPPPTSVKAPPPGFQKAAKKPPPGFVNSGSSRPPPGFAFKEEKKPDPIPEILAPVVSSNYTYIQPSEFQERNQQLVKTVRDALVETEKFDEFKTKSWQFRQNEIMTSEYYYGCEKLMGKEKFNEVFPELLILLPDINKQQDLLSLHNQSIKKLQDNVLRISGKSQRAPWSVFTNFDVCPTCSQVLLKKDSSSHTSNHSINDFPTLWKPKSSNTDFMGRGSWVAAK